MESKLEQLKRKLDGRVYHSTGNLIAFVVKGRPHTVIASANDEPGGSPTDDLLTFSGDQPGGQLYKTKDVDKMHEFITSL